MPEIRVLDHVASDHVRARFDFNKHPTHNNMDGSSACCQTETLDILDRYIDANKLTKMHCQTLNGEDKNVLAMIDFNTQTKFTATQLLSARHCTAPSTEQSSRSDERQLPIQ